MMCDRTALGMGQPAGQWYPGEYVTGPASCGANPCDFTDFFFTSDNCAAWLQCAGQPPITFGGLLAQGGSNIAAGAAGAVGSTVSGALSNPTTDIVIAVLGVVAIGAFLVLRK